MSAVSFWQTGGGTMTLKDEIYLLRLDRREVAARLGLSYDGLSRRLNGFTSMSTPEIGALRAIVDEARKRQAQETAQ